MIPDTGHLASALFEIHEDDGDGTFAAKFTQIGELERAVGSLETSHLMTADEKSYIPDDLIEPGEIECEFYWNGVEAPPEPRVRAVLTVTLPVAQDQTSAGSWTASGFFLTRLIPAATTGTVMKGKAKFKLDGQDAADGGTKFTYTPAVAKVAG